MNGGDLAPILASLLMFPAIVAMLLVYTGHRQKMADLELKKQSGVGGHSEEIQELKQAVGELREALHAQMIAVDSLMGAKSAETTELPNRLESGKE